MVVEMGVVVLVCTLKLVLIAGMLQDADETDTPQTKQTTFLRSDHDLLLWSLPLLPHSGVFIQKNPV